MKQKISFAAAFGAVCLASFAAQAEEGFQPIFNGKDLAGWNGQPEIWSVKDEAITGVTKAEPKLTHNTFLVYTNGDVSDFELRLSYRVVNGNSGIQYRSKVLRQGAFGPIVGGYQADLEAGKTYSGILYEEQGRGILAQRGQKTVVKDDGDKPKVEVVGSVGKSDDIQVGIKNEDWNDYVVIAKGNHLQHFINGMATVDVVDENATKAAKSGVLALQVHVGAPMTVQFKNIRIKPLSGAGAAASDLDRVQGDWTVAELVMNGQTVSADALAGARLNIKASAYSLDGDSGSSRGTLKLGESASPKTMEVTTDDGTELPAIYEISGDTLKVCYALNGAARPKEFKSTEGSDHVFTIYKRKAK